MRRFLPPGDLGQEAAANLLISVHRTPGKPGPTAIVLLDISMAVTGAPDEVSVRHFDTI